MQAHYMGHHPALAARATVQDHLELWAAMASEPQPLTSIVTRLGLTPMLEMRSEQLSAGWKRRVSFARLLLQPAQLWLLDEPFANLDDSATDAMKTSMHTHLEAGGCIIFTAHSEKNVHTWLTHPLTTIPMLPAASQEHVA